ncbi:MAG TPA: glycosyltransferase family 4 protein [Verrucomicrobiae bacterium]|nr:glycosyltransferase family 4 protein [Verrucomicrobiae bacterium]
MDNLKNPFWRAGQARATREVGKRLAKKHQVTVYCTKYPGYLDYQEDGITYKHIGIVSHSPRITNAFYLLSLPFVVKKIEADVILENLNAPTSFSFTPWFTKIPVVVLPTMLNAREFTRKYFLPFHWLEAKAAKGYKYFLPYSDTDTAKILRLNPEAIYKKVPQGVDESFFDIKSKKSKHILFLGRFDLAQKGIDLLLSAYSLISDEIKYPLVLAGHGPDEKKIQNLIKKFNLTKKVTIFGPAYGRSKVDLIREAAFVVFPSRHDEISLWSLEALASGLPLVAFDLPESTWMTEKVCLKSKPFDIENYSQQILTLASDKKLLEKMRKATRPFVRKYKWEDVAKKIEGFLKYAVEAEQLLEKIREGNRIKKVSINYSAFTQDEYERKA